MLPRGGARLLQKMHAALSLRKLAIIINTVLRVAEDSVGLWRARSYAVQPWCSQMPPTLSMSETS
jgi:hypothetical protein